MLYIHIYTYTCIYACIHIHTSCVCEGSRYEGVDGTFEPPGPSRSVSPFKNTRIIARNHFSQIPPGKVLYPGVKSTQNGPSWAIMGYF